jgi:alkaline phosphatase
MKNFTKRIILLMILMALIVPFAVLAEGSQEKEAAETPAQMEEDAKTAKYVFMFIGDGMGSPQTNAAEAFLAAKKGQIEPDFLSFSKFPAAGLTTTHAADRFITGSAASATAMSCGYKTAIGVIAMDPNKTKNYTTIAEMAKAAGMKVGIVSSVDIDHATPAAFYSHAPSRSQYYEIGLQMADSGFDYFGGGRVRLSKTPEGKPTVLEVMEEKGWQLADTKSKLKALTPGKKAYAYSRGYASDALLYAIDGGKQDYDYADISLAEFTAKGIELLDNPAGFFMMVEGGKIDWACHANDAGASIRDTLAFDDAVKEAIDFYYEHPDETLIVVTGDHECGGLTLGFAGTGYATAFDLLAEQKVSYEYFDTYVLGPYKESVSRGSLNDLLPEIEEYFGLSDLTDYERQQLEEAYAQSMTDKKERASNDRTAVLYGGYEPLTVKITHLLNRRAGLSWTSYSHTGVPVPTFAMGVGQEKFNGYYDNTDIFWKTAEAMKLAAKVAVAQ